jgi:hypothetical protein
MEIIREKNDRVAVRGVEKGTGQVRGRSGTRLGKKVTFVTVLNRWASRSFHSAQSACGAFHIQQWRRRRSLGEPLLFFIGSKPGNAEHCKNDVKEHIVIEPAAGAWL